MHVFSYITYKERKKLKIVKKGLMPIVNVNMATISW